MTRPAANFNVISLTRVNQWPTSGHHLSSLITGKHVCCGPASVTFDTCWLAGCCFCFHFAPPEHLLPKYSKLVWLPFFFECVPLYRYIGGGTFWRSRVFFFVVGWLGTGSSILLAQLCTENGSLRARFRRSQIEQMGY